MMYGFRMAFLYACAAFYGILEVNHFSKQLFILATNLQELFKYYAS